jgi:hypothetical protein
MWTHCRAPMELPPLSHDERQHLYEAAIAFKQLAPGP